MAEVVATSLSQIHYFRVLLHKKKGQKQVFSKAVKRYRDGCAKNHSNYVGVGMAAFKQDMLYKDYTSNSIPTYSFCSSQYLIAQPTE